MQTLCDVDGECATNDKTKTTTKNRFFQNAIHSAVGWAIFSFRIDVCGFGWQLVFGLFIDCNTYEYLINMCICFHTSSSIQYCCSFKRSWKTKTKKCSFEIENQTHTHTQTRLRARIIRRSDDCIRECRVSNSKFCAHDVMYTWIKSIKPIVWWLLISLFSFVNSNAAPLHAQNHNRSLQSSGIFLSSGSRAFSCIATVYYRVLLTDYLIGQHRVHTPHAFNFLKSKIKTEMIQISCYFIRAIYIYACSRSANEAII